MKITKYAWTVTGMRPCNIEHGAARYVNEFDHQRVINELMPEEDIKTIWIPPQKALDGLMIYLHNFRPGKGSITIVCFGRSWTAFFGGMPDGYDIKQFCARAEIDYLTDKLSLDKQTKSDTAYLRRIVESVHARLQEFRK